jgi:hypothetical protein
MMKKLILSMIVFAIMISVSAQENVKQKEVGFAFSNLDNFALTYKFGDQKSMWRIMALHGNISSNVNKNDDEKSINNKAAFGFALGKQFQKPINENFRLIYGADLNFGVSNYKTEDVNENVNKTIEYSPGINAVFGFNYDINEYLVFGLELLPGVNYTFGKQSYEFNNPEMTDYDVHTSRFNFNVSTSSAFLTLAYKIK